MEKYNQILTEREDIFFQAVGVHPVFQFTGIGKEEIPEGGAGRHLFCENLLFGLFCPG
jgi:hypothetical protein